MDQTVLNDIKISILKDIEKIVEDKITNIIKELKQEFIKNIKLKSSLHPRLEVFSVTQGL